EDRPDSLWSRGRFPISPLSEEELRSVVEAPASEEDVFFETTELVRKLVREVTNMPGALPLLSFTLSAMFTEFLNRPDLDKREISEREYTAVGGVIGSLRKRAEALYNGLPDDAHKATMRRLMVRMIATEGGDLARRRVYQDDELDYPAPDGLFHPEQIEMSGLFYQWLSDIENPLAAALRTHLPTTRKEAERRKVVAVRHIC